MKKLLPLILLFVLPVLGFSQADSAVIGSGYIYQTYYSFDNGTVKQSTSDWDLAFGIGGFNVSIRTNDGHDVKLYLYPKGDVTAWGNVDTTGLSTWTSRVNNENNWDITAFTDPNANHPDYGWGVYNSTTHNVEGDSLYIIQTKAGNFKKLRIDGMYTTGNFEFTYADLDGSNEVSGVVNKNDYTGKNFAYYSIDNNQVLDLEPLAEQWDIVFSKYRAPQPQGGYYNVTGIQTNKYRTSAKAEGVDVNTADWSTQNFVQEIGTIGWDWKSFDRATMSYNITEDLTYFVADTNDHVWQITMTGYKYNTGTFYFNQTKVANPLNVNDIDLGLNSVSVFPNPATNNFALNIESKIAQNNLIVTVYSLTGSVVYSQNINVLNNITLNVTTADWKKGVYLVRVGNDTNAVVTQLIVQ